MDCYDNEIEIINYLQEIPKAHVALMNDLNDEEQIFSCVHNPEQWKEWINSSGKSDLPPDFYCNSKKLMMDVMRVDDHSYINKKGKIVNPYKMCETKILNELKSIMGDRLLNKKVVLSPNTGLPTEQDHNYQYYKNNFTRVVRSHISKISQYKANHPGYKIIFLIFDESSSYVESIYKLPRHPRAGEIYPGRPCFHFVDSNFLNVFIKSEIDYVIWFTPYKYIETQDGDIIIDPRICVYNAQYPISQKIKYDESKIYSYEE